MTVSLSDKARKELSRLDAAVRSRILDFLQNRLEPLSDPRSIGQALKGQILGVLEILVGDYRIICKIVDEEVTILVISIGHRREVYKG